MNINSALPGITPYQPVTSAKAAPVNTAHSVRPETNTQPSVRKTADYEHGKIMTKEEKADFAKSFYEYKDDFWSNAEKGTLCKEYTGFPPLTKESAIELFKGDSRLYLGLIGYAHDHFSTNLQYTNPELAKKNYGFTLGDDGNLKILDPSENLTPAEKEWLTESLNRFQNLREHVHMHAKVIMTLVDHDTETFGKRFALNLDNFHSVIDYLKITGNSSDSRDGFVMHGRLVKDITERATLRNSRFEATA